MYIGEWKDGKKHGKGKFTCNDGTIYEGDFVDGEMQGYGVKKWIDGRSYEGNISLVSIIVTPFSGNFVLGEFEGKGIWVNSVSGENCDGSWKCNRLEGISKHQFK